MPHKRNPVSATIILSAAATAPGHVATMLGSMVAAHERPAGAWHAEWSAVPSLFGLASGALAEARRLAEGLEVDAARMSRNLDLTHGMLFADAAAGVLAKTMGRGKAHDAVEHATSVVRDTGQPLQAVLAASPDVPASVDRASLAAAFDLSPSISAAARFVDRACKEAQAIRAALREPRRPTA